MDGSVQLTRLEPYNPRLRLLPHVSETWLPVCYSGDLKRSQVRAEQFVGNRVCLFRDERGNVRAIEDVCPHRGVPLSLGECVNGRVICSYHGLAVDADGRIGTQCTRTFPAREHYGLIWLFAGESQSADNTPLPQFLPFGTGGTVDTVLHLDMQTHWSMVLDNGIDLTHDYLHRKQPFFFKTIGLDRIQEDGDDIEISYRATLRNEFNRRREGLIRLRLSGHLLRLDFDGQPIVHSVLTPRSANGRQNTQWWFVSVRAKRGLRLYYRLLLPMLRKTMLAAFNEDRLMLEKEAEAVFDRGVAQTERNPMVRQVQDFLQRQIESACRSQMPSLSVEVVSTRKVLDQVARGELAVFHPVSPSPLTLAELTDQLAGVPSVRLHRRWGHALLAE